LIPSGEVRDPERTVPKAIALAMVGVTVLYIALQVVAQGISARRCRNQRCRSLMRRGITRRVGPITSPCRRRDLDVRPSRRHDAVDPAHRLRARA
jgi:hypothetical protein